MANWVMPSVHSMAAALGADKIISTTQPVAASTSIVRGRYGVRVALQLAPMHLATALCHGQPQGNGIRSTRSRAVTIDPPQVNLVWSPDEERAFALAMRRFGADLWTIQRRVLPMKSLPQARYALLRPVYAPFTPCYTPLHPVTPRYTPLHPSGASRR